MLAATTLTLAAAALLPAAAGAHSLVRTADGEVAYLSTDAVSLNTLVVKRSGAILPPARSYRRRRALPRLVRAR